MNGDALRSSHKYVYYLTNVPKCSGDVILGNSGRYCSVYKLQDNRECGLIKTTLISSVSHFNLMVETLFGAQKSPPWRWYWILDPLLGGKLTDICLIRIIAYSG